MSIKNQKHFEIHFILLKKKDQIPKTPHQNRTDVQDGTLLYNTFLCCFLYIAVQVSFAGFRRLWKQRLHFEFAKRNTCKIDTDTLYNHLILQISMPVNVSTNNLRVSTNEPDALPWINLLTTETAKFRPARRSYHTQNNFQISNSYCYRLV